MVYIKRFKSTKLSVLSPEYQLKLVRQQLNDAQQNWQPTTHNLIKDIYDIGGSVLDMCQQKYDQNPHIWDGCEPVEHDTQELIDLVNERYPDESNTRNLSSRNLSSRGLGNYFCDVANGLGRALGNIWDFAKDTATLHPYDALKDISNILGEVTGICTQTVILPVDLTIETGVLVYRVTTDTPYECECKLKML